MKLKSRKKIHKNREEFEGGLEKKGKEKGGNQEKKKRVIKHTLEYLYETEMAAKESTKTGKNFRGGGDFSGWPEYIPLRARLFPVR